ncbi:MAG: SDR family NAD(P)-dependent oxidoreductase [Limnobacter sp.]|nr:SDR family NAD(P)-dependent oxidoreductase [Limnobacter sp.]
MNTKTALITGASSGIGKALALEMARRGYNLALTARRTDKLEQLQAQIADINPLAAVEIASMDVQKTYTIAGIFQDLIKRLQHIDVVVVNAGSNMMTGVGKGQLKEQLDMLQTNVMGAVATVDAAAEYFRHCKKGHIVGISSLASLTAIPKQASYCASKSAFSMYLESAALELSRHNIAVTRILPGFVKTEIVENMEQYPFLVTAEQAASEIADNIEKKKAESVVPGYPWAVVKPFMRSIPAALWRYVKV